MTHKIRIRRLLAFLVLTSFAVFGQLYTGTIAGTVQDPSGAVIPNAKITITDVSKGFNYTAQSDASGLYTVRNLPPATYRERVEASGFNPYEKQNIVLEVNGNVQANAQMQVASAGQTVTVSESGATQLQTEDAVTGQTINRTLINDLPLISRQVFDLAYLAPGVSQPPGNAYGSVGQNFGNNFVSNGERNAQADILIDGISSTSYEQNTGFVTPLYTPSVEAVDQFRIQQGNFSAEIGFASGTVVNLVTRSGTNSIHGELYEFFRNTDLNANQFFSNSAGIPRTAYHQNNFGAEIGGPVIKNKLFYFVDYDGNRNSTPAAGTFGVPSAAERNGNFGELCGDHGGTFNGAGLCSVPAGQIWDPYSAINDPSVGAGGLRQNFVPFNRMTTYASPNTVGVPFITAGVAGNLINPIAQKVMSYFPLPNTGGVPGTTSYNPYGNFYGTASNVGNNSQYDIKLDTRFTDNDQLSVRFSQQWGNSQIGNIFGNALDAYTQGPTTSLTYSGAVNYNHTFSPSTLLTATAGYDHNWAHTQGAASQFPNVTIQSLGFPSNVAAQLNAAGFNGLPAFQVNSYAAENGNANIGGQPYSGLLYGRDVYHFIGSVEHTVGNHDLHMGAEYRVHRINFTQFAYPNGLFSFGQGGTSEYSSVGGDSMATFLTGFANNWSAYELPVSPATQNMQYGGFIQDNWHVNSRLTMNIGVRYDIDSPRTERHDQMSFFDPNAPSPLAGVPGVPATGALEYVGQNGYGRSPYKTYYGGVGPRFGFAYRAGENWTVRGGYGIYYDPSKYGAAGTGSGAAGFLGYDQTSTISPSYNNSSNWIPNNVLGQPVSYSQRTGNTLGTYTNLGGQLGGIPVYTFNTLPQEQSWSFGLQRQLPFNILVDAEYVGRKGTHLYLGGDTYALDHLSEATADAFRANPGAFNAYVPVPTALANAVKAVTPAYSNVFWNSTWAAFNGYLPYPQYNFGNGGSGLQNVDPPIANSIYHALQLRVEKRMTHGLQFLFTYTKQKSIDNSSIAGSSVYIDGYSGATLASIQDPNNLQAERSLSNFDIAQVAQVTGVYQLPFGKGKAFGSNWNGFVDAFLGGWQLNGIYRWDTGMPLILFLNGGTSLPTFGSQRPNIPIALQTSGTVGPNGNYFANIAGAQLAPIPIAEPSGYTGPVCYSDPWYPCQYANGSAPRVLPNVRAPGTNNVTASLFKSFHLPITEGTRLEFRAEAFNLLNHVQFAPPSTTVGQANFGIINSQANSPRELQLALKLYF